jgi:hypothetical protein
MEPRVPRWAQGQPKSAIAAWKLVYGGSFAQADFYCYGVGLNPYLTK